jgi:hypothetical protein
LSTGSAAPQVSTGHLEQDLQPLRIATAEYAAPVSVSRAKSWNDSAQSPAWSRNVAGREPGLNLPRLACEHERRQRMEALPDALDGVAVRPLRLLERISIPPGRRGPRRIEDRHCDLV